MIDILLASAAAPASSPPLWNPVTITTAAGSALALGIAGWSAWQTWLYHPRPELDVSWKLKDLGSATEPRPRLDFHLVNRGKGEASDVRFEISSPNRPSIKAEGSSILGHHEQRELAISLVTGDLSAEIPDGMIDYAPAIGRTVLGKYTVRVSWRQSPKMNKIRHKRFSYLVGSDMIAS